MTISAMTALLGPEFDAFLFAPVAEEEEGGLLTVLSALARSDVDPWEEAAELARMPREAASHRLTLLLAALPDAPEARSAHAAIADRLVKLLPLRDPASIKLRARSPHADPTRKSRQMAYMILINLLIMVGMLGAQLALASFKPPTVSTHDAATDSGATPLTPKAARLD